MMNTADVSKVVLGFLVFAALTAAALFIHYPSGIPISHETTVLIEQPADYSNVPPVAAPCAVIEVLAYVRTDTRLETGDIQWMFTVNRDDSACDYECYFEPSALVDNLAMSNQDGSQYFVGMMKGRVFLRKSPSFRSASYITPQRCFLPDGYDMPTEPTIIIEGNLTADGFNIEWTTANLPSDCCKILFKYLDQQDETKLPLICLLDGYSI